MKRPLSRTEQEIEKKEEQIENLLKTIPMFRELEPKFLAQIVQNTKEIFYPKDTIICESGRKAKFVFVVMKGEVSECAFDPFLFSMEIKLGKVGHHFGEMGVLLEEDYLSTAVTTMPTKVLQISGDVYRKILWGNPYALKEALKWFCHVLQKSFQRNLSCNLFNNKGRLAYILLMLLRDCPNQVITISQEKLAHDYCGLSRQTLSSILKKWEAEKIVSLSRCSIQVCKPEALREIFLSSSKLK